MESKKINQLATELAPDLSDLTIIGDPTTGISKKITLSQMASLFTGTVEEYANFAAFPLVGVADTIYVAKDTNVIYRWDSTAYVVLSPNIIASLVFNDANGFDGNISLVGSVATLTITTALTTGSVPFIGASGALIQDNANLFFDDTNNRLGINTNAPTTPLDVFGSGIIGRINGTSTNNAYLGFASAGTNKWSVGNVQSDHRFRIFSEANSAELISVLQTGEFGIGIANPTTKFHIDGGASALIANLDANVSVAKSLSFRSDNSNRINLEVSGTESGSNAGANFFLRTYTDAGSLIETPLSIVRSTGVTTIKSLTLTNVLSIANGGTGSATQNFVDLTTTQTIAGSKTIATANSTQLTITNTETWTNSSITEIRAHNSFGITQIRSGTTNGLYIGGIAGNLPAIQSADQSNNAVALSINPFGGSVAIGTSTPLANLDLGSSGANNIILRNTSGAFNLAYIGNSGGKLDIGFSNSNSSLSPLPYLSVTSAGNVGIGVTPSNGWVNGYALEVAFVGSAVWGRYFNEFHLTNNYYYSASTNSRLYANTAPASDYEQYNGTHAWYTAPSGTANTAVTLTPRMTLANNGNLLIGATSNLSGYSPILQATNTTVNAAAVFSITATSSQSMPAVVISKPDGTTSTSQVFVYFLVGSTGGSGQINANGASQAAFGTLSDIRLKENITILPTQLSNILALKPCEFDYKDGSGHQIGFIAQEIQEVYPDAVSEGKDGFLTVSGWNKTEAYLVKAIQEQQAQIEELKALINK